MYPVIEMKWHGGNKWKFQRYLPYRNRNSINIDSNSYLSQLSHIFIYSWSLLLFHLCLFAFTFVSLLILFGFVQCRAKYRYTIDKMLLVCLQFVLFVFVVSVFPFIDIVSVLVVAAKWMAAWGYYREDKLNSIKVSSE